MAGIRAVGAARSQGRWPTRLLNDIPATTSGKPKHAAALAGATRDSISIGARYDPGQEDARGRSPDRAGRAVQPGLRADGLASECPGEAHPTTGLRKNASDAAGVTRLQTGERPRSW